MHSVRLGHLPRLIGFSNRDGKWMLHDYLVSSAVPWAQLGGNRFPTNERQVLAMHGYPLSNVSVHQLLRRRPELEPLQILLFHTALLNLSCLSSHNPWRRSILSYRCMSSFSGTALGAQ